MVSRIQVVKADDGQVAGDAQPALARRLQHAQRQRVVGREDRIRRLLQAQQRMR